MPGAGHGVQKAGCTVFGEIGRQIFDGITRDQNADFRKIVTDGHSAVRLALSLCEKAICERKTRSSAFCRETADSGTFPEQECGS